MLLKADAGQEGPEGIDTKIAEAFEVSLQTVERLRKRSTLDGVEAVLEERRPGTMPPKLLLKLEARLTALRCSDPPSSKVR